MAPGEYHWSCQKWVLCQEMLLLLSGLDESVLLGAGTSLRQLVFGSQRISIIFLPFSKASALIPHTMMSSRYYRYSGAPPFPSAAWISPLQILGLSFHSWGSWLQVHCIPLPQPLLWLVTWDSMKQLSTLCTWKSGCWGVSKQPASGSGCYSIPNRIRLGTERWTIFSLIEPWLFRTSRKRCNTLRGLWTSVYMWTRDFGCYMYVRGNNRVLC